MGDYWTLHQSSHSAIGTQLLDGVLGEVDVSGLLPKIRCPSLVLHRRHIEYLGLDAAKLLASRIPDGHFVAFDGDSTQIYSDADAILTAVDGFLGSEEEEVRND